MESTQASNVLTFPKSKKRGPKVRTGPSAKVFALPTLDRAIAAIDEASSNVDRLVAIMSWVEQKYGATLPSPCVMLSELRAAGVLA
jgi:hypothetical protein